MESNIKFSRYVVVTGGYGFIGSHVIRQLVKNHPDNLIINFDAGTYAAMPVNLIDIDGHYDNYVFYKGDITKPQDIEKLYDSLGGRIDDIIHLAAESHVDRSIVSPGVFVNTNVIGTTNLLNAVREWWKEDYNNHIFINMGTDEIFGALGPDDEPFDENSPINPHSPYSASKASAVLMGKTYYEAYGLPVVTLCSSNAIGPNQYPEKLVPLTIDRLIHRQEIPIYGEGRQVRDWLYVEDIARAIDILLCRGKAGEMFCIGGGETHQIDNYNMVKRLIFQFAKQVGTDIKDLLPLIKFIPDPRGNSHDFRYAINYFKIAKEYLWMPQYSLDRIISTTVKWYLDNQDWIEMAKDKSYSDWIETQYGTK